MIEFSVKLSNRPGQLATLSREMATAGVNIEALAAITAGTDGFVKLVVDQHEAARRVLSDAGMSFEERRVINAVLHDKPGALADMAEALANTGVNIEAMYLLNSNSEGLHFAVAVDDDETAKAHL
ncbi:MAG: ACT domain-containing protein [Acidimicrobiia bacterium]|nr:ACT domain-containing protein [Acidimicrobiia bacterium]